MPNVMLNQIWNNFNFTWDVFVKVLVTYQAVFWVMLVGFIFHWLPDKVKSIYEGIFTRMPLILQMISVAIIVVLMYQAITGEAPPFVYLSF